MLSASKAERLGRVALVCAFCLVLAGCPKSPVTRENYDKISNGMTLEQVEAVLGRGSPQGDGSMVAAQAGVDLTGGAPPPSTVDYLWEGGKGSITVTFNKQGKVVGKRSTGF